MNEFMRNQNIESATTRWSPKHLEKLQSSLLGQSVNFDKAVNNGQQIIKYGGRHTGSRQMERFKKLKKRQQSEESPPPKTSNSKHRGKQTSRYKQTSSKDIDLKVKINEFYT